MSAIALEELVRPLTVEQFAADHWLAEQPFLSEPNPELVARLRELEALASPESLIAGGLARWVRRSTLTTASRPSVVCSAR